MTTSRLLCWGLIATAFLAPLLFLPGLSDPAHLPKALFLQLAALVLTGGWLFSLLRQESPRIELPNPLYPLLAFLLYGWSTTLWSVNPRLGHDALLIWGAAIVFFLLTVNVLDSEEIPTLLAVLLGSTLIVSCLGIAQHLFLFEGIPQYAPPAATFANKNTAVHLLVLTFPVGVLLFLGSRERLACWGTSLTLALMATYLVYTRTRAGWLAVTVELLCFALYLRLHDVSRKHVVASWSGEKKRAALVALLLFLILIHLGPSGLTNGFGEIGARLATLPPSHQNNSVRLAIWQNSLLLAEDHPLGGVGSGNFRVWYPLYHVHDSLIDRLETQFAHNDYLHFLAEHGMAGTALLLAALVFAVHRLTRLVLNKSLTPSQHLIAIAISLALGGSAINAFFCFPYQLPLPPFVALLLVGIGYRLPLGKSSPPAYGVSKAIVATTFLAVLLALPPVLFRSARVIAADHHLLNMVVADQNRQWEIVLQEGQKAVLFDPTRITLHSYMGKALLAQGYPREAMTHLEAFLHGYPNDWNGLVNMGLAHLLVNEEQSALFYLNGSMQISPNNAKIKALSAILKAHGQKSPTTK